MSILKNNLNETSIITDRGGEIQMLITPKSVGSKQVAMGFSRLLQNEKVTPHIHDYSEEAFYVLRGEGVIYLIKDSITESITFKEQDAVLVPKGTIHWIENLGKEPLEVVFVVAPLAPKPELGHRSISI